MRKIIIIYNPVAGKGKAEALLPRFESELKKKNADYEIRLTERPWHAVELAREAVKSGKWEAIAAAGGDGTSNEVINGLMLAREEGHVPPALGVVPVGRGNDFAYGVGVPDDLVECVRVLVEESVRKMDVGKVVGGLFPEGRYFGNGLGCGFDTIVGLEAAKMKHVHGFAAYVFGALKTLFIFKNAPLVHVQFGEGVVEQRTDQISIMNGRRLGGTFFMAPKAILDDGLFDFSISNDLTRRQMVSLLVKYIKGTQLESPLIRGATASRFYIVAKDGNLVVHADGEIICEDGKSILVETIPRALGIIAPPSDRYTFA